MAKRRKRDSYIAPQRSGSPAELAPYVPMPKQTHRSWWPLAGAALLFVVGVGSAVGASIARDGEDPPVPVPGVATTTSPAP